MAELNPNLWRPAADLSAARFENAILSVSDLFRASLRAQQAVITGKTFVNCRLEGPAVFLALGGVTLADCDLGDAKGDMRNLLFRPLSDAKVTGAIPFTDCRFEACSFFMIGYTGGETFLNQLLGARMGDPS